MTEYANIGWELYIDKIRALSEDPFYNYESFIDLKKEMIEQGYIFPPLIANDYDLYSSFLYNLTVISGGLPFPVFTANQIEYILMPIGDYSEVSSKVSTYAFIAFLALFIFVSKKV